MKMFELVAVREKLGDPIYSRFDSCIGFKALSPDVKEFIVEKVIGEEIDKLPETLKPKVNVEKIKEFSRNKAKSSGNYRIIKNFIRDLVAMYRLHDILTNKKEGDESNYGGN